MKPRLYLDIDPRLLRLPYSRRTGADIFKLHRQIARYGSGISGISPLEVSRGTDGELMINNGVTRATRIAMLLPGTMVRVEIIDNLPVPFGSNPKLGDLIP